jgi:hypothetical protein
MLQTTNRASHQAMGAPLTATTLALCLVPCLLLLLACPGCLARHKHFHSRVPILHLNGAEQLIGTVREDEQLVAVSPQLRILQGTGKQISWESWLTNILSCMPRPDLPLRAVLGR